MNATTLRGPSALLPLLFVASHAIAQDWTLNHLAFSITATSATIGSLDVLGTGPIGQGTVLTPPNPSAGPNAPLGFVFRPPLNGPVTLPRRIGPVPNRSETQEIDALSYINYGSWVRTMNGTDFRWLFSVDQQSGGSLKGAIPTESATNQHAADIWRSICPTLLMGPTAASVGCNLEIDADGLFRNTAMLGLGLRDLGARPDDVDALAVAPASNQLLVFHSLAQRDAILAGFSGADIFWRNPVQFQAPVGPPFTTVTRTYATAAQLGLMSLDDVDGLVVFENTFTNYQPSGGTVQANGMATNGSGFFVHWQSLPIPMTYASDRIFFSITRNSPTVGLLDSRFNQPIQPGDILEPPAPGSPAGTTPRIVVMAELIGMRVDRVAPFDLAAMDDMDALEYVGN
ncbi:MAG: hypothetical protein U1E73_13860 [Planctomycetota bacterium]